jgi:1,4-alpha-glucan branching enzyme
MLFMGEEWGAAQPFPFFCDFGGELAEAVRKGRRQEFARFPEFQDEAIRKRIPDPQAEGTFTSAKLGWDDLTREPHAGSLDWYRRVLAVRREAIVPLIPRIPGNAGRYERVGECAVVVRWGLDKGELTLAANLSAAPVEGFPVASGRDFWREGSAGEGGVFGPWSVRWTLGSAAAGTA